MLAILPNSESSESVIQFTEEKILVEKDNNSCLSFSKKNINQKITEKVILPIRKSFYKLAQYKLMIFGSILCLSSVLTNSIISSLYAFNVFSYNTTMAIINVAKVFYFLSAISYILGFVHVFYDDFKAYINRKKFSKNK